MLTLAARLDVIRSRERLAGFLTRLGEIWRVLREWPRATSRLKDAIEFDPKSGEAHFQYAICLAMRAHGEPSAAKREEMLAEASRELNTAQRLGADKSAVFHWLGWICDERQNYAKSIAYYRQAIAASGGSDPNTNDYKYDLSCSLAKAGQLQDALSTLREVVSVDKNWELIPDDEDFDNIRNDPSAKAELEKMLKNAPQHTATP
jgi:tetratricopeptide (TPR) repeat protein